MAKLQTKNNFQILPIAFLLLSISFSILLYLVTFKYTTQRRVNEFSQQAEVASSIITSSLDDVNQVLISAESFYKASNYVDRTEWHDYVENVLSKTTIRGIRALNVIQEVPAESLESFQAIQNSELDASHEFFSNIVIKPELTDPSLVVTYVEPHYGNEAALGYNVATNSRQLPAFQTAKSTGISQLTDVINLVQDEVEIPAFIMTKAVEIESEEASNSAEPQKYISAVVRGIDFFDSIGQLQQLPLVVKVYDTVAGQKEILYTSHNRVNAHRSLSTTDTLLIGGQEWFIEYDWDGTFLLTDLERSLPVAVLVISIALSVMIFMIFYFLSSTTQRAHKIAQSLTKDLEEANAGLDSKVRARTAELNQRTEELQEIKATLEDEVNEKTKDLQTRLKELERMNDLMVGRENKMAELKERIAELESESKK